MSNSMYIAVAMVVLLGVFIFVVLVGIPMMSPLAIGPISGVECHDEWMRVSFSWTKHISVLDSRTFTHDTTGLSGCPAWGFLRDNQEQPELESVKVCGRTVTSYWKAHNEYNLLYQQWTTTVDWVDAATGQAFIEYMRSLGYSDDTDCTAEVRVIFDSRECDTSSDCPVDEWVGEPYCGI